MSADNIFLNVNNVEVIYNHVILVLKGVSFQVPEGSIVSLLGGNGAGKTTTLRAVCGMVRTRGEISFDGRRIEGRGTEDIVRLGIGEAGFGGVALYRAEFDWTDESRTVLGLGTVHGVSSVRLNGQDLGTAASLRLWPPSRGSYRLSLVDASQRVVDSVVFSVR